MADLAVISEVETTKAAEAFADYVNLGPTRSLEKLYADYQNRTESVPTRQLSRLKRWSTDHHWQERIKAMQFAKAEVANEYRADTWVAITKKYHQIVVIDEPKGVPVKLESLNSIYDRVKPEQPAASSGGGGSSANLTIQFIFQEVVRP